MAYESRKPVWFDDLKITHQPALVVQENHYYPFGMNITSLEKSGQPEMKFQYNGKEKQSEFGLDWLDYGARMYDAQLGRWHAVDPSSDQMRRFSPYNYAWDNPVVFIDPDGMFATNFLDLYDERRNFVGSDGVEDGRVRIVTDKGETVILPSANVRWEMGKAVRGRRANTGTDVPEGFRGDDATGGFHEEGGMYGIDENGNEFVTKARPGGSIEDALKIDDDEERKRAMQEVGGINVLSVADGVDYDLDNVTGTYHTHPNGEIEYFSDFLFANDVRGAGLEASSPDLMNAVTFDNRLGITGNHFVLSGRLGEQPQHPEGMVTIFASDGKGSGQIIARFPLPQFINLGNDGRTATDPYK